jgi:chorismate mutase
MQSAAEQTPPVAAPAPDPVLADLDAKLANLTNRRGKLAKALAEAKARQLAASIDAAGLPDEGERRDARKGHAELHADVSKWNAELAANAEAMEHLEELRARRAAELAAAEAQRQRDAEEALAREKAAALLDAAGKYDAAIDDVAKAHAALRAAAGEFYRALPSSVPLDDRTDVTLATAAAPLANMLKARAGYRGLAGLHSGLVDTTGPAPGMRNRLLLSPAVALFADGAEPDTAVSPARSERMPDVLPDDPPLPAPEPRKGVAWNIVRPEFLPRDADAEDAA